MPTNTRTREYPFGRDALHNGQEILVVCLNDLHREYVVKAFEMPARYIVGWASALAGARFDKVIVFTPLFGGNRSEEDRFARWINEEVRTHLSVGNMQEVYLV